MYALPLIQQYRLTIHRLDNVKFRRERLGRFQATVIYEEEQSAKVAQEEAEDQINAPYVDETLVFWMATAVRYVPPNDHVPIG